MPRTGWIVGLMVLSLACESKTTTKVGDDTTTPLAKTGAESNGPEGATATKNTPPAAGGQATLPHGGEKIAIAGPAKSLRSAVKKQDFAPKLSLAKVSGQAGKEAKALNKKGLALNRGGKFAEAKTAYLAALGKNPGHILARYNVASVFVRLGEHDKALALLLEIVDTDKCPECQLSGFAMTDDEWSPLWGSRLFHSIVADPAIEPEGTEEGTDDSSDPEDEPETGSKKWLAAFCEPGERRKGRLDDVGQGTVYCMKGGRKHGKYYTSEHGYDMSEGTTTTTGTYRAGVKHGQWSHWESFGDDWDGNYKNGVKHGLWLVNQKTEASYEPYVNGELHGTQWKVTTEIEYPPGYATRLTSYKNGVQHGAAKSWSVDDKTRVLTESGSYLDGKKHGVWLDYDSSTGHPTALVTYKDGEPDGDMKYWNDKGKLVGESKVVSGTGTWIKYSGNALVEKGSYRAGVKVGPWIEEAGKGTYRAGVRVGKWTMGSGGEKAEGEFKNGVRVGAWSYYDDKGKIRSKGMFVAGKPHGKWTAHEMELLFKNGRLLEVDEQKFNPDEWVYDVKEFAKSGSIWERE